MYAIIVFIKFGQISASIPSSDFLESFSSFFEMPITCTFVL